MDSGQRKDTSVQFITSSKEKFPCSGLSPNKPWPLLFYSLNSMDYIIYVCVGLHVKHCGFVRRKRVHRWHKHDECQKLIKFMSATNHGEKYIYILRIQIINKTCTTFALITHVMFRDPFHAYVWVGPN